MQQNQEKRESGLKRLKATYEHNLQCIQDAVAELERCKLLDDDKQFIIIVNDIAVNLEIGPDGATTGNLLKTLPHYATRYSRALAATFVALISANKKTSDKTTVFYRDWKIQTSAFISSLRIDNDLLKTSIKQLEYAKKTTANFPDRLGSVQDDKEESTPGIQQTVEGVQNKKPQSNQ